MTEMDRFGAGSDDTDHPGAGLPVIQTPLIEEAAKWEAHIKLGLPYRTAYEARMRHFLALCAKSRLRAKSIPLVVAFRCGYWEAAGDPVAIDSQELAKEAGIKKQTFLRLLKLAGLAWSGIERDDSCRVYPNYAFGAIPGKSGTHTGNEEGDSVGDDWPDVLLDPYPID